jgi:hypothetical protein
VLPKPGTELRHVIERLRGRVLEVQNIQSRGAPTAIDMRDRYLVWADDTERLLRSLFDEVHLTDLHTDRFWHIRDLTLDSARPWELINTEIAVQAERLGLFADALEARAKRLMSTPGQIAVPDTNVFLHFKRFDTIDWTGVVGATPLRVVIPLSVVEELDLKKAARRRDLADRARSVFARLESLMGPTAGAPAPLRDQVTVEVLVETEVDPTRIERAGTPDTEILDVSEFLGFLTGQPITLVTGDVSMRLRAAVRGLRVVSLPDSLRVPLDEHVQELLADPGGAPQPAAASERPD